MYSIAARGNFRKISLGCWLAIATLPLGACGYTPQELGITGPSPGQSLTPPPPTAAMTHPDATPALPGVRTGDDAYSPSVMMAPPTPGKFYGSD